jgi:putative transposase
VPRAHRIQAPEIVYHVGSRAVDKQPIFGVVDGDCAFFLVLLGRVVVRFGWRCYAYTLIHNHFHLVVETPRANIAAGMQFLKAEYARWFNAQVNREGALFERRYWDRIAAIEGYLLELSRYLALNSVRAGIADRPEVYEWSSYAATIGAAEAPAFLDVEGLLDWFGGGEPGRAAFAQLVGEGVHVALEDRAERDTSGV